MSAGRFQRNHVINDIICRALISADVPATREPRGLLRSDGRRPDGVTLIPWSAGRSLAWDATVADTWASTYLPSMTHGAGAAAEAAAASKNRKYEDLSSTHIFVPVAIETLGSICEH